MPPNPRVGVPSRQAGRVGADEHPAPAAKVLELLSRLIRQGFLETEEREITVKLRQRK